MSYTQLIETNSTPRSSISTIEPIDHIHHTQNDYLCRVCKTKLIKKQETDHTPIECLSQRCELLENEVARLKDHDIKTRLQIKEFEMKMNTLENALQGVTAPKQQQATPYSFGLGHKIRKEFRKANSVDSPPPQEKHEINYDNIIPSKRSNSRERVGLFGSLGASSQR